MSPSARKTARRSIDDCDWSDKHASAKSRRVSQLFVMLRDLLRSQTTSHNDLDDDFERCMLRKRALDADMPSAPLASTSQSRKKQKTNYHTERSLSLDDNKENHDSETVRGFPPPHLKTYFSAPEEDDLPPAAFPYPATPANRIPLDDLVGNTEDAFNRPTLTTTPNDCVTWQHGPRSSDPSSSYHTTQRSRKRARSSSPSSSQLEKSAHFPAHKGALNMDSMQKSLKTPQNDPSIDLWTRYAGGNLSRSIRQDSALSTLAHLLPSSPQTPSTTDSRGKSIRRVVSCGAEWPTTETKKRKTPPKSHARVKDIFAASKKRMFSPELPRSGRVGLLLEKIQESLSTKPVDELVEDAESPSNSSPIPDGHAEEILPNAPEAELLLAPAVIKAEGITIVYEKVTKEHEPLEELPLHETSSSDYGGDEIDYEFVEQVEFAATQAIADAAKTQKTPSKPQRKPPKQATMTPKPPSGTHSAYLIQRQLASNAVANDGSRPTKEVEVAAETLYEKAVAKAPDDFSDDDFGLDDPEFAEELGDLAAQYEFQDQQYAPVQQPFSMPPQATKINVQATVVQQASLDEFDDPYDDDVWKDIANGSIDPQRIDSVGSTSQKYLDSRAIKRYLIVDVFDEQYENSQGRRRPQKLLSVKDERSKVLYIILLRQSWYDSRCIKGSYVHLIGDYDQQGQCIVDDADNMIILHPDHLISATVVADSFTCTRRAALQDRVKATGAAEKPQVYGHILHEIFGEGLRTNDWSPQNLRNIIVKILPNYIESLYEIQVQISEAIEYLMGKMSELQGWASVFVSANPNSDAQIQDRNGALATMAINKLLEVEEHVWSPMYGLKGNIDATVQVVMQLPGEASHKTLTVPLEFKTGKKDNNESHRAQTALYTLLFSDRYDIEVTCGVLYYLETAKTFRVERVRNEIRHMIIQRNELACYVHDKLDLPPMIKKEYMCKKCYAQTSCFTYHKLVENGDGETSGMGEVFEKEVKHLTPIHQEFFRKWDDLLTKEERDSMKFRRELWTMLSSEREALGRCFGNVVVEPGSCREHLERGKINRFEYSLVKYQSRAGFSFTESQLTIGEPIVISDEKGHFALANGFVTKVRPTRITVAVDRRLHNIRRKTRDFDPKNNQSFTGVMEVTMNGTQFDPEPSNPDEPLLLRLDKDEFSNGMATARNNIIRLMEKDLYRARELRQVIIEGSVPSFKPSSSAYTLSGPASQRDVNVDQRLAIEKVMSAKDYALVLGMPGTGKTTTIAHIIRTLVSQNKSVLLTSYTHTAVDNILLKIKDDKIPILRLGAVGKVHPEVQAFADLGGIPKKTIAELEKSYTKSMVVATTCLGINQPIFNARVFDYCIVDEASQITLPVCLGPIRMANTFILVGDHFQLPPLVANKEAQQGGLDVSLFKMLSDAQPSSVINLEHQYRMAEDIMLLSNTLIYSGRLKCGNALVAGRTLRIPDLKNGLAAHHYAADTLPQGAAATAVCVQQTASCWLWKALKPSSRCLFLNTDTMGQPARETTSKGSRITNTLECTLTAHLVTALIHSGVPPNTIGVITFYRSQLVLLRTEIKAVAGSSASNKLEMHTADKYQGRDKEIIVLSCVRSNTDGSIGELLKDWRRVNVAITRAKSKLIIIGSKSTFAKSEDKVLEGLVKIMDDQGWVQDLPTNASESHKFEGGLGTQTQTQGGRVRGSASQASQETRTQRGAGTDRENQGIFRKPAKVIKGSVDLDKLLDKRPVLRDIINSI